MAATILHKLGISPTENKWMFTIQGDPSSLGLAAGVGSVATKVPDFTTNPADRQVTYIKTGANDTDWTPQDAIVV